MSDLRPRGLGRGLSALLGEPVRTEAPKPVNNVFGQPGLRSQNKPRAPIEPPRNVFELPITQAPRRKPAPTPPPNHGCAAGC
jgi:hypothetical protein